jgi:hypothetical protein
MVSPLVRRNLELPWAIRVFLGDSSEFAFGIVETVATAQEIREEAKWALTPGWLMADVEKSYRLEEREAWCPRDRRLECSSSESSEEDEEEEGRSPRQDRRRKPLAYRVKRREPPKMSRVWDTESRWKLTWRGRWRMKEHINVQELRVISKIIRRASLDKGMWGKRILLGTDSKVALCCVWKGRSSSPALLRQCRMICGLSLSLQIQLYARWIESERNHADGTSRMLPIGAAPETLVAHRDRIEGRQRG